MSRTTALEARAAKLTQRHPEEEPPAAPAAAQEKPAPKQRTRKPAAAPAAPKAEPAHKPPAPRAEPVRLSVDLAPVTYRAVKAFPEQMNLPELAGKLSVPTMAVMIALAQELEGNEELRKRIAARVLENLAK